MFPYNIEQLILKISFCLLFT